MSLYLQAMCDIAVTGRIGILEGELLTQYDCRRFHVNKSDLKYMRLVDVGRYNIYQSFGVRKPVKVDKIKVLSDSEKEKWYEESKRYEESSSK